MVDEGSCTIVREEFAHYRHLSVYVCCELIQSIAGSVVDDEVQIVTNLQSEPEEEGVDQGIHHLDTTASDVLGCQFKRTTH